MYDTTGLIGFPSLCSLTVPYNSGACGFVVLIMYILSSGIRVLHFLTVDVRLFWKSVVGSLLSLVSLFAFMNSSTLRWYSSCFSMTIVFPLSAWQMVNPSSWHFLLIDFMHCVSVCFRCLLLIRYPFCIVSAHAYRMWSLSSVLFKAIRLTTYWMTVKHSA